MIKTKTGVIVFRNKDNELLNSQFVTYDGDHPTPYDIRGSPDRFRGAETVLAITPECRVWILKHPKFKVPCCLQQPPDPDYRDGLDIG